MSIMWISMSLLFTEWMIAIIANLWRLTAVQFAA